MAQSNPRSSTGTHWRNCIVRNRLTAYSALVYSTALLWGSIRELHRPFPAVHLSFREHWASGYGTILLVYLFWRVRCARERLWLGIALLYDAIFAARVLIPTLVAPAMGIIKILVLLLWAVATIVSISFAVSATMKDFTDSNGGTH